MSARRETDDTVLDGIAGKLGVGTRNKTNTHHGNNLPSVTPNPREVRASAKSLAKPVDDHAASGEAASHDARPAMSEAIATGSTAATTRSEAMATTPPPPVSEMAALQSTVTELAGQMAWFVQRLAEDDVVMMVN